MQKCWRVLTLKINKGAAALWTSCSENFCLNKKRCDIITPPNKVLFDACCKPALISTLWAVGCQLRMPTRLEWPSSFTTGSVSDVVSPPSGISQICSPKTTCHSRATFTASTEVRGQRRDGASPWRCSPQSRWRWCCRCEDRTRCPGPDLCVHIRLGRTCLYVPSAERRR